MIKLIVSDIDGTILEDGGNQINPELLEVILELRNRGIQFAAASGRGWTSIEQAFAPIKERIFYLGDNGAYVGCHGRMLFHTPIDRQTALDLIRDIRLTEGLDAMISCPNTVYLDTDNQKFIDWLVNGYKFHVKKVDDITTVEEDIIKVSAYIKTGIEKAAKSLRAQYQDKGKLAISGDMWMDFMASGVNKGQAVKLLQESLGIQPTETMAFGDQLNDMEMLAQAYYSFAVGNARDEVKQEARFQTDTNVNDGVLKVLKLLL